MLAPENIYKIKMIKFGLLDPSKIRKIGVKQISQVEIYDEDGRPVSGGALDPALGVTEPGESCPTCHANQRLCPGHFGYLELVRPVYHVGFVKEIKDALNSTCSNCKKLLLPEEERQKYLKIAKRTLEKKGMANLKLAKKVIKKASS